MIDHNVNIDNFDEKVLKSDKKVLVDFWADWCMPCKMLAPILDEISNELGDTVNIVKINIDQCENLARKYNVSSIPTLLLFDKGEIKNKSIGLLSKEDLLEFIKY